MDKDTVAMVVMLGMLALVPVGIVIAVIREKREEKRAAERRCDMLRRAIAHFKRMGFVDPREEAEKAEKAERAKKEFEESLGN